MKKILFLFLFLPTLSLPSLSNAAVFTDAQLKAALTVPTVGNKLTCGKSAAWSWSGDTTFATNATFQFVGGLWQFPAAPTFARNTAPVFQATNLIDTVTLSNGSTVRRTRGNGTIQFVSGINIWYNGAIDIAIPVRTFSTPLNGAQRFSDGRVTMRITELPNVVMDFTGFYLWNTVGSSTFIAYSDYTKIGSLKLTKAGRIYHLTCYATVYNL